MQVQAFEGYWENERFYPLGQPIRKPGKFRAILTLLDEPIQISVPEVASTGEMPDGFTSLVAKVGLDEAQKRTAWLKRLEEARELAKDEKMPDIPLRSKEMRPPVIFND